MAPSLLVSFTGSEPFLHSELAEIVRATAAWHFPLLVTNGCLVTAARAREVWEAGLYTMRGFLSGLATLVRA